MLKVIMNKAFGALAVVGVIALLVAVMIGIKEALDGLAENKPKIYEWVTGICTIAVFILFVVDAFFISTGIWGPVAVLFLAPPWAHAFWLRDGEDHFSSEQEGSEEIKDGA